jgi:NAD(P)-dependent dehydrogenase (short-subunit alcohol dehydrogenase family)
VGVKSWLTKTAGLKYIGKPQVAYAATKAALINFARVTAVTYASKGVRLNTVVPGLIHTPLVKSLADKYAGGDYEAFVKQRNGQVSTIFRHHVPFLIESAIKRVNRPVEEGG